MHSGVPSLMPPPLPKRAAVDSRPAESDAVISSPSGAGAGSTGGQLRNRNNSIAGDNILPPPMPPRPNIATTPSFHDNGLLSADMQETKPLLPPRPSERPLLDVMPPSGHTENLQSSPGSLPAASRSPTSRGTSSPDHADLVGGGAAAAVTPTAAQTATPTSTRNPMTASFETSNTTAPKVASNEEIAFQFDRHVQEIRRRRTVARGPPKPDPEDFTTVEAESGKRILNVPHYLQAYLAYFIESLARDDRVARKLEPLQWSRIRALLSRLFDSSSSAQSFGLYAERVMYWENPPETVVWLTIYSTLWYYQLWLPGFMVCIILKMLNNRYKFVGNLHAVLNVPQSLNERVAEQQQQHRRSKMRSQLHQLIASRDMTDWLMTVMKIWGPHLQSLAEENIGYLERFKNLMRWERPYQTWRVIALLMYYILISAFFPFLVLPAVGFAIGVEFFFLLPLQKKYPRFSHVFSPLEWILWGVPTDVELAVERLTKQQEDQLHQQQLGEGPSSSSPMEAYRSGDNSPALEPPDLNTMSPASRIKYEYQNRSSPNHNMPSSSSSMHSFATDTASVSSSQVKNEYHCMLRGKPGKLIIHEENIQFRSAKLLGRDIEAVIPWDMIDTIKKTKTMSIGVWSTPGIEITDINGRMTTFQNVVRRDDAFRMLVITSGKKWASVN